MNIRNPEIFLLPWVLVYILKVYRYILTVYPGAME
jgi:hypothetical protein